MQTAVSGRQLGAVLPAMPSSLSARQPALLVVLGLAPSGCITSICTPALGPSCVWSAGARNYKGMNLGGRESGAAGVLCAPQNTHSFLQGKWTWMWTTAFHHHPHRHLVVSLLHPRPLQTALLALHPLLMVTTTHKLTAALAAKGMSTPTLPESMSHQMKWERLIHSFCKAAAALSADVA